MQEQLKAVKIGLFLVMCTLVFGIGLGIGFGVAEDSFKSYIANGVSANAEVHDNNSASKIWRYGQRAHFHATGISAFSIGLILLVMHSSLKTPFKKVTSILIGLGGFYPLSWFSMFLLAPEIGRSAAHHHLLTESVAYIGSGGLLFGIAILCANLFFGLFQESK